MSLPTSPQAASAVIAAGAQVTPPLAVVATDLLSRGVPLMVHLATGLYIALQASYLIWKWRREARTPRSIEV
ncbi:hypothetical protein [Azohydromonas lata]|uniref:Uncharacterized protein n=1 Tax=Azohydromonas lata TaxID=45677 RepID=A0ABU5ID30_9BURK|nr:hypothetical protein [Azohydromonas lata]MDZ5457009.1 hypothetical protein [Azohydromonas lata]